MATLAGSSPALGTSRKRRMHAGTAVYWTRSHLQNLQKKQEKFVFAHFMVGNTYPYTLDDWLDDLNLASEQEIDGFVLNIGIEEWQKDRVADCLKASDLLSKDNTFKFFFSFDMTSIPGHTVQDTRHLASYLLAFADHPRMFKKQRPCSGRNVVVSTFSGERCYFGQGVLDEGWAHLKRELSSIVPIDLIPSFFLNPTQYSSISSLDGIFNWNGGWPVHLTPESIRGEIEHPKLDSDHHHLEHLDHSRSFMAAVSPWFFTHYGPDSWNKNWIYRGDDWLFVRRWEQLIEMRDRVDIVQVISWNDYGESHYIGPIKGAQPNSEAWVDGYPHEAWLYLNSYFARAFKDGVYPNIQTDKIFVWARPHPKDAIANDSVPRPTNWELTDDLMWIVIFAIAPCIVGVYTTETDVQLLFEVKAGMTKLSAPLKVGGGIKVRMVRNEDVVAECAPIGYRFEGRPAVYNFNAFVAMSC